MIVIEGLEDLAKSLTSLKRSMRGDDLGKLRGRRFSRDAKIIVATGQASLPPNKTSTVKIQGRPHAPMAWHGRLLEAMKVRVMDGGVEVGYFGDDNSKPGPSILSDGKVSQSKLTFTEIATMQSTGYRVPLTGSKGARVRGFLAAYGIFPKKSKTFLTIRARPFLANSAEVHETRGNDLEVAKAFMTRLLETL